MNQNDPALALLVELGVRAKAAESRVVALEGVIAELNQKLADLMPKEAAKPEEGK